MKQAKLTAKQEQFAQLILQGKTQADAYRGAYSTSKMTDKQVWEEASKLAASPKVAQRINELRAETAKRNALVVDDILNEIRRVALSDPRKLFDENGQLKKITELDDDTAAAIASVEVNEIGTEGVVIGHTRKLKIWDKNAALANAARILGLNDDTLKVKTDPLGELLAHVGSKGSGLSPKP